MTKLFLFLLFQYLLADTDKKPLINFIH